MTKLYTKKGSRYHEASVEEVRNAAIYSLDPIRKDVTIKSPTDSADYFKLKLSHLEHESFCALYLDNRHRGIAFVELFRGTIDGTSVYPREVVKDALRHNAAAVVFCHNHPSGIAEPSAADERITHRLKAALELIDIRLLDHIVVAGQNHTSLAQRGLI